MKQKEQMLDKRSLAQCLADDDAQATSFTVDIPDLGPLDNALEPYSTDALAFDETHSYTLSDLQDTGSLAAWDGSHTMFHYAQGPDERQPPAIHDWALDFMKMPGFCVRSVLDLFEC